MKPRRKEDWLAAGLPAAAGRLDGDENTVNLGQRLWVVKLEHPALVGRAVQIQDSERKRLVKIRRQPAPGLKRTRTMQSWLMVEVVGIKDKRLAFRKEDPAKRALRLSITPNICDFGNIEVTGTDQVADVTVVLKKVALLLDGFITLSGRRRYFIQPLFKTGRSKQGTSLVLTSGIKLFLHRGQGDLGVRQPAVQLISFRIGGLFFCSSP
jgi:hypothetical protein